MMHHNIYLVLLTTLSTWMFAQSLGEQINEAGQVQGALSSAMVNPSSLYNLQVPVFPSTSQVTQPGVPTITGITSIETTSTETTSTETTHPTSTSVHTTSTAPSGTHTTTSPPTSDASMLKSVSTVFSIIGIPIFLFIYANM